MDVLELVGNSNSRDTTEWNAADKIIMTRVPYTFFVKRDWDYLLFRETGFVIRNFKIFLCARERGFWLCVTCERRFEFVVIRELSCFSSLNFQFFKAFNRMCSFFFSFVVAFWTDKPFVTYLVAFMILTDWYATLNSNFCGFTLSQRHILNRDPPDFCVNVKTFW